jgi:sugar (pentulose or hexulose) kinase
MAVGVTGTTPTLLFLDESFRPLGGQAFLWCDLRESGPPNRENTNSGIRKIAALCAPQSERFRRTRWIVDSGNYLILWLTGNLTASRPVLVQKFAWDEATGFDCEGFDDPDIRRLLAMIPQQRVLNTGEVAGELRKDVARHLGLPPAIPVIAAGYDSVAAMVGGGLTRPSRSLLLSVGTSVVEYLCPEDLPRDGLGPWTLRPRRLPGEHHIICGGFEAGMQSIKVVHQKLKLTCTAQDKNREVEGLAAEAELNLSARVFALPFGGVRVRAPLNAVLPTAIFADRELVPSDLTILIALWRGVAYFVRHSVEDLRRRKVRIDRIHLVGGGTKSMPFCKMLASATGLPLRNFGAQAASRGAALLAASSQVHASRPSQALRPQQTYTPDASRGPLYQEGYSRFVVQLNAALGTQGR